MTVSLSVLTSGCAGGPRSAEPSGSSPGGTESASPDPSGGSVAAEWRPPPQGLPSDPGLRERLGPYAEFVLGTDGLVPAGSIEHLTFMERCIESAGFEVEIQDGGIQVRFGAQESFYREVKAKCDADAVDSGLVGAQEPPDEPELAAWYDGYRLTYDCMVREGFPVNPIPSKDSYIESDGRNWHPYELVRGDLGQIETVCPQDLVVLFEMLASGTRP